MSDNLHHATPSVNPGVLSPYPSHPLQEWTRLNQTTLQAMLAVFKEIRQYVSSACKGHSRHLLSGDDNARSSRTPHL